MKIVDELKRELERGVSYFKVRGEISGALWGEISVTENTGSPIWLGTTLQNTKFRAQSLISGAIFEEGTYRIDNNSHNPILHQHVLGSVSPISEEVITLSGALLKLLGSEYWKLENC